MYPLPDGLAPLDSAQVVGQGGARLGGEGGAGAVARVLDDHLDLAVAGGELAPLCRRQDEADEVHRADAVLARVPGLASNEGACVPPYFVFQARVDGTMLDR